MPQIHFSTLNGADVSVCQCSHGPDLPVTVVLALNTFSAKPEFSSLGGHPKALLWKFALLFLLAAF